MGAGLILLTMGEIGAAAFGPKEAVARVPAPPVRAVNTTGAGDTLVGLFLVAWLDGVAVADALAFAVEGASRSVAQRSREGLAAAVG